MKRRAPSVYWIRILSVASVLAVVSLSCSDEPNAVGIGVLPPDDLVSIDTVVIREATSVTFKQFISPNDRSLLIGTYRGYEARTLIRFPSLPDTLGDVLSTSLHMKPIYTFGDSTTSLRFTVHKILIPWGETTATWDSVTAGSFYEATPHGDFAQIVSDTTGIQVPLDTTLVNGVDQFGILLLPEAGLSIIKGFASFQSNQPILRPRLETIYERNGRRDTITTNDSLDLYVANVDLEVGANPELMYVQAGVSYRSRLRFDLSAIPVNAIVHNATLELTINRSESEPQQRGADSLLLVYHVSDSSTNEFESTRGERGLGVQGNPDLVTVNVTNSVQRWVLGESNQGVLLRALAELSQLDLIAIFSPRASEGNNRPRLTVTYSPIRP
ncbi:MAG: DNRLRE domain-containing protein [Bacteroidota bacterium]